MRGFLLPIPRFRKFSLVCGGEKTGKWGFVFLGWICVDFFDQIVAEFGPVFDWGLGVEPFEVICLADVQTVELCGFKVN